MPLCCVSTLAAGFVFRSRLWKDNACTWKYVPETSTETKTHICSVVATIYPVKRQVSLFFLPHLFSSTLISKGLRAFKTPLARGGIQIIWVLDSHCSVGEKASQVFILKNRRFFFLKNRKKWCRWGAFSLARLHLTRIKRKRRKSASMQRDHHFFTKYEQKVIFNAF